MARQQDYSKLGFFLILSLLLITATVLFFVGKNSQGRQIRLVTFFEEPVTGLDSGATILLKGVKVGQVGRIRIDPESGYVRVDLDLDNQALDGIGVFSSPDMPERIKDGTYRIPEGLRVKILRNPIMGTARLLIDTPSNPPKPLPLGRQPERPYIPSMPSPESSFFTSLEKVTVQVPEMLDRTNKILERIDTTLSRTKLEVLVDESIGLVKSSREQVETVGNDLHKILEDKGAFDSFITQASEDLRQMRTALEEFMSFTRDELTKAKIKETAAKIRGALDTLDTLGSNGDLMISDLRASIPALETALEEISALARVLREQPDSLLYGRKKPGLKKK